MDVSFDITPLKINLALDDVETMVMVCSHERSGTHFLMNSLASCTKYVSNPWMNFDLIPFGGMVNFFSEIPVRNFFASFAKSEVNGSSLGLASIVKSHYPVSLVKGALDEGLKIAYIYRNPADTLLSFWRLLHSYVWFEGPKLATPLELAQHIPCGQSQRYQMMNCGCYFDRWALHVTDAVYAARDTGKVIMVSYEDLISNYASTLEALVGELGITLVNDPVYPSKEKDVVVGADLEVSDQQMQDLRDFCAERVKLFPDLPEAVLDRL